MKIAIAQLNPRLGDFNFNKEKIQTYIRKAIEDKAQVLILPYGAISGFPQGNLLVSEDFRNRIRRVMIDLAQETEYNDLSIFVDGQEILAKGGVSAESMMGDMNDPHNLPLPSIFNKKNFEIFVNLGPKVFEKNRPEAHELELKILARDKKAWVLDINLCGATDEILFTGLSTVVNPQGEIIARLPFTEEAMITVDLEHPESYPVAEIPAGEEILRRSIVQGIRDYYYKNHFQKLFVSVSGGIDSALVLALAVEAVGAENIITCFLPSRFSSDISQEDAIQLCNNLNVPLEIIPIEPFHQLYIDQLHSIQEGNAIWKENIQARIRGNIVMSIANAHNALVLTTGNKSESAMGYCTLYGDTCGGFAPISDLLKTEVRALTRYLNLKYSFPIIPERIITRPPSAELSEGQEDEKTLPNYEFLDQVLFLHCEEGLDCPQIISRLGRSEDVLTIFTRLYQNGYKRKQSAVGLKLSKRYFGLDWHILTTVAPWFKHD